MELTASTIATLSPIAGTMQRAAERIEYFGAIAGPTPDGWQLASDIVSNPDAVNRFLQGAMNLYEIDDRQVGAAFLVLGYFWNPFLAAFACFAIDRRLPDLSAASVAFKADASVCFTSTRFYALPDDPAADHPDCVVLADLDAMRDQLVQQFNDEHAAPLFASLRSIAPLGVNAMRANYIDRLVSAITWTAESLNDFQLARDEVPAFVNRMNPKSRAGLIELHHAGEDGIFEKRSGCCLNYRIPGNDKCGTCSLRSMDDRLEIFRGLLSERHAERQAS